MHKLPKICETLLTKVLSKFDLVLTPKKVEPEQSNPEPSASEELLRYKSIVNQAQMEVLKDTLRLEDEIWWYEIHK